MADKLSSGISTNIAFAEGEIVKPAKLTAITAQLARVASQLEKAVGDVHGDSWPYTSSSTTTLTQGWGQHPETGVLLTGVADRKLDIANLARLIGPASNLNPRMLYGEETIIEDVPLGVREFSLRYPVVDTTTVSTTDTSLTDKKAQATEITNAGDWHVGSNGKVRSYSATAGGTITYTANPGEFGGGQNYPRARFNVIPDPNQIANGTGCALGALDGQGRRPVTLPTITHQQSDIDGLTIALDSKDINYNKQLRLPLVLTENLTTGDEIPSGFLFLKNETTGEVYKDATYYYNNTTSYHIGVVDLTEAIAAGNVFSTITVGTDITSSIDDLRIKTQHSHNRDHGEPFVHISGLVGQYEEAGVSGPYGPSTMPGNIFSQYLHRDGYQSAHDNNLNDNNAMRGPLVMGLSSGNAGNYTGATGATYAVRFGDDSATSPYIRRDGSDQLLINHGGGVIELNATNEINLNADGEINLNTDDPTAHRIDANALTRFNYGMRGDVVGTVGNGNNGIAPYVTQVSITMPAGTGVVETVILPADIKAKQWYSVNMMIYQPSPNATLGTNIWVMPQEDIGHPALDENQYQFWVDDTGPTNELKFIIWGSNWTLSGSYNARIVIWYVP